MKYVKENWKFLLFVLLIGTIGSYFTVIYSLSFVSKEILESAIKQVGSKGLVITISTIQTVIYVILFGIFGVILSNKVGLWKKIKFEKNKLFITSIIALIGGIALILCDLLIFSRFNEIIKNSFDVKPTYDYIITSLLYGGVVEEVMMRLFFMSLISFLIIRLFYKKEKNVPVKVFVIANIISAILFALGHLPSTINIFGEINTLLFVRCLVMNGLFGLAFGWLYRKHGIHYAMLAHFGCHLISKLIWLLFI